MNRYISKNYTNIKNTIDRQHREGAAVVSTITSCQRGNRAKKRGCLGGSFIIPRNVGKNSKILRNPLKFAFLTIFWCK